MLDKDAIHAVSKHLDEDTNPKSSHPPILGNMYGSLKRSSNEVDPFVYEYFEGSTNKIKCAMKFSALLELFD